MILFLVSYALKDYKSKAIIDFTAESWIDYLANGKKYITFDAENDAAYFQMGHCDTGKIVTIGDKAFEIMQKEFSFIKCFKLPDPSPTNPFLNNEMQVNAVLEECKKWLR